MLILILHSLSLRHKKKKEKIIYLIGNLAESALQQPITERKVRYLRDVGQVI